MQSQGIVAKNSVLKKATNVSLNVDLLKEAKQFGINLSATFNKSLEEAVRLKKQQQFIEENKVAIKSCNVFTEKAGLFSDEFGIL